MGRFQKTTVEIDSEQLDKAREALHTESIKETVNGALREVARRAALERAAEFVRSGKLQVPDLDEWADERELQL